MAAFQAAKVRNKWVVVDTVAGVHYTPYPRGKRRAQEWARELNDRKGWQEWLQRRGRASNGNT